MRQKDGHMPFRLYQTMVFGQYKGRSIEWIIDNDPQFISWSLKNIDWFRLNKDAMDKLLTTEHAGDKYPDGAMVAKPIFKPEENIFEPEDNKSKWGTRKLFKPVGEWGYKHPEVYEQLNKIIKKENG